MNSTYKAIALAAITLNGCAHNAPIVDDGTSEYTKAERLSDREYAMCVSVHKMLAPLVCN